MPPSHETNPVTFPAQDRRTILYSILLEKLREETGTRWNLLPPLFDDLSSIAVPCADRSGCRRCVQHDPYLTRWMPFWNGRCGIPYRNGE